MLSPYSAAISCNEMTTFQAGRSSGKQKRKTRQQGTRYRKIWLIGLWKKRNNYLCHFSLLCYYCKWVSSEVWSRYNQPNRGFFPIRTQLWKDFKLSKTKGRFLYGSTVLYYYASIFKKVKILHSFLYLSGEGATASYWLHPTIAKHGQVIV